jgi:hypothetical protein
LKSIPDGAGGALFVWADFRVGAGDIYAQRVDASGNAMWGANGTAICALPGTQWMPDLIADGGGGAFVVWSDGGGGPNPDVYAQHVGADGAVLWTANGVLVNGAANAQENPTIVPDGAGGAIVAWTNGSGNFFDVWAQRLSFGGQAQWTPGGVRLTTITGYVGRLVAAPDGAGGSVFAWSYYDWASTGQWMNLRVQAVDGAGALRWGTDGIAVTGSFPRLAGAHRLCTDGAAGAILAWPMFDGNLTAQRFAPDGSKLWGTTGHVVSTTINSDVSLAVASDGLAGAFLAWTEGTSPQVLRAQRIGSGGAESWASGGVPVSAASGGRSAPVVQPDGAGGATIAWSDSRAGNYDIYAQRLDSSGAPRWVSQGVALCTASAAQSVPCLVPAASSGWIAGWEDYRNEATRDLYCQRVDAFGYLGDAAPVLQSVADTPGDDGGSVRLTWLRSYLDRSAAPVVVEYHVLHQSASPAVRAGSVVSATTGWELAATVPAITMLHYTVDVPSDGDDAGGSHPLTTYRVEAHSSPSGTGPMWSSAAANGWSIDNLAPPVPTTFHGTYDAGTTSMTWDASPAADFTTFRLYRGSDPGFVPSPANRIAQPVGTAWVDAAGEPFYYRLTAVDDAGNESSSALYAAGPLDVESAAVTSFALEVPRPHPVRSRCAIAFSVPRAGTARLALFDVAGRRLKTLLDGPIAAGVHVLPMSPVDDAGSRLASGLYLLRLDADGRSLTRRVLVTQ